MKYALITVLALAGAFGVLYAQSTCHDEMVCTPIGGCRWVAVCSQPAPPPMPGRPAPMPFPAPVQCHDENICTPIGGCRWVTICK